MGAARATGDSLLPRFRPLTSSFLADALSHVRRRVDGLSQGPGAQLRGDGGAPEIACSGPTAKGARGSHAEEGGAGRVEGPGPPRTPGLVPGTFAEAPRIRAGGRGPGTGAGSGGPFSRGSALKVCGQSCAAWAGSWEHAVPVSGPGLIPDAAVLGPLPISRRPPGCPSRGRARRRSQEAARASSHSKSKY